MTRPGNDAHARTPSSAMLVQMLFVLGAVGTGVVSALVTWMGRPPPPAAPPDEGDEKKRDG